MANSVTIRTTAPGAKQAATEIGMLKTNISAIGSKTGGPLGGMLGGLGGLGAATLGAGVAMGVLGGAIEAAGKFLGEGVKSAMEEEVSLAKLDTALKNNVTNWDGNRDAIDKAITSRMDLGFEDDALRDSLSKLVASTHNSEDALRLQTLAMDIARAKNIDLAAATDIVLKANVGNTKALKAMGIEIEAGSSKAEIFAKLTETFGGQAEAWSKTLEGQWAAADIAFGEMQEDIGEDLLPLFHKMATTTNTEVIPAMRDLIDVVEAALGVDSVDINNNIFTAMADLARDNVPVLGAAISDSLGDAQRMAADDVREAQTLGAVQALAMTNAYEERARDEARKLGQIGSFMASEVTERAVPAFKEGARQIGTGFNDTIKTIRFGADIAPNLADELRDGVKNDIKDAMDDVKYAITHPLELAKQTAQIEAALVTLNIKRGLASNTPEVNAVIDQQIQTLQGKWSELTGIAYQKGVNASNSLESGLRTFNPPNLPVFGGITTGTGKNRKRKKREAGENAGGGGRASGGPVQAGQSYLVGEDGPEILHMGGPGYVDNGRGSRRGGGGSLHVHVHLSTREFRGQSTHDRVVQGGGPAF